MKKALITLLKLGVSIGIIAYLVWDAQRNDSFADLWSSPKDWGLLALAALLCLAMVVTTFLRWFLLVRALELPFSVKDSLRLGFLGFLLNFVSLGSVGGDLFKAIFVAREHRGRRAEAVATIVVDRIIGLYALFLVATTAIVATGLYQSQVREIEAVCRATILGTAISSIGVLAVLTPGFTSGAVSEMLGGLPVVGPTLSKLIQAVRIYRRKLRVLIWTGLMSVGVHCLSSAGIYLVARGLWGDVPSLGYHFVVVPLGMLAGILPLPSGLGAFEFVIESLYVQAGLNKGQGLVVAFGYRVITILIAIVGLFYYLASRREVQEVLHETEQIAEDDDPTLDAALLSSAAAPQSSAP